MKRFLWIAVLLAWGCASGVRVNGDLKYRPQAIRLAGLAAWGQRQDLAQAVLGAVAGELGSAGQGGEAARQEALAQVWGPVLPDRVHPDDMERSCNRCQDALLLVYLTQAQVDESEGLTLSLEGSMALYEPEGGRWVWRREINLSATFAPGVSLAEAALVMVRGDGERGLPPLLSAMVRSRP